MCQFEFIYHFMSQEDLFFQNLDKISQIEYLAIKISELEQQKKNIEDSIEKNQNKENQDKEKELEESIKKEFNSQIQQIRNILPYIIIIISAKYNNKVPQEVLYDYFQTKIPEIMNIHDNTSIEAFVDQIFKEIEQNLLKSLSSK